MFWKNRLTFEMRLTALEAEIAQLQPLKANVAQLETQLASLRGSVNAKYAGAAQIIKPISQKVQEDRELTPDEMAFIDSLPEHEKERLKELGNLTE